jgi:RNA polymerase sigma-70 factor (ECF subfamily)
MAATAQEVLSHNGAVESRGERLLDLFRELSRGRPEALEGIYALCADDLYGLALWRTGSPADAADAVQNVFVRLAERRSKLKGVRNPRSYLFAMAHRAAVDLRRKARPAREVGDCPFLEAPADDPERRLDARRGSQLLSELPEAQREAVYLHDFAGLTFAEVGRATGVPTFTAASRYRLGIRRLRRMMGVKR